MAQKKNRIAITPVEAAQIIGVSEKTVNRMLVRRELEGFRVTLRRGYRVYLDSIEKFLRDREILSDHTQK